MTTVPQSYIITEAGSQALRVHGHELSQTTDVKSSRVEHVTPSTGTFYIMDVVRGENIRK